MALLTRTWIAAARARHRLARVRHRIAPATDAREGLVRRHAGGKSFADIGCMWGVDGAIAFLAEQSGASAVTGLDLMAASAAFDSEHARRASKVRFLQGDLHDAAVIEQVGKHDVVWCAGVIYHAPNPLLTLERLRSITGETLILASETIPEVPWLAQACVFLPALPDPDRRAHAAARPGATALGVSEPFDREQSYGAWWWGMSRSALRGMLVASGFEVLEQYGDALHATFVARPVC
jgi:hypothetical protein